MRILFVSDEESPYLWDYFKPECLENIDLIISCGDLKAEYLSFLVTMAHVPLFYIHGNHDESYDTYPPEGCTCIDGKLVTYKGLRILGLGGSMRYNEGAYQYTDAQMRRRIRRLHYRLMLAGGVDLVVSHAPILGCGDSGNGAHRGFAAFRSFALAFKPRYWVHGHVHLRYDHGRERKRQCGETTVINACERYILEI